MHVDDQQVLSLSREVWQNQLGLTIDTVNASEPSQ